MEKKTRVTRRRVLATVLLAVGLAAYEAAESPSDLRGFGEGTYGDGGYGGTAP